MRPALVVLLGALVFEGISHAQAAAASNLLLNRVNMVKMGSGGIVATPTTMSPFVTAGATALPPDPGTPITSDTVFEIGSLTKTFVALLLCDMVQRGEVSMNTTVQSILPANFQVPTYNGTAITLQQLALHTSGLPRLPTGATNPMLDYDKLPGYVWTNPYANFTPANLANYLGSYRLTRAPGARYEYSNLGYGLLGYALANQLHVGLETALKLRIFTPLGMTATFMAATPPRNLVIATGYDAANKAAPAWTFTDALAGGGALRSTGRDLATFEKAMLGLSANPLAAAFTLMTNTWVDSTTTQGVAPGLRELPGWTLIPDATGTILAKNGGTAGFSSDMKLNLTTKKGAVGIINSSVVDMGELTWAVLGKNGRMYPPRANLPNLASYAGTYTWTDAQHPTPQTLQVSNIAGTYLFLNNIDTGNYYPEANYNFFKLDSRTTLLFGIDNGNNITTVTVTKGASKTTATRTPPAPKPTR